MSSRCSQQGNMLVKVRGSRPAWIRYAFGGLFSFFSVAPKQKLMISFNEEAEWNVVSNHTWRGSHSNSWNSHLWKGEVPWQYCSTVSMAHFLSESQRIRAEPVLSLAWGHQPCHRYTSWWLSTRNRAGHHTTKKVLCFQTFRMTTSSHCLFTV